MKIAASILDINFRNIENEISSLAGLDFYHLDIMDGNLVNNLSFGPLVTRNINFPKPVEAHLMMKIPSVIFDQLTDQNIREIIVHQECFSADELFQMSDQLKNNNIALGIAIDLQTPSKIIDSALFESISRILIMSVQAGFGGQSFDSVALKKAKELRDRGYNKILEIDGGVKKEHLKDIKKASFDIAVIGSAISQTKISDRPRIIQDIYSEIS